MGDRLDVQEQRSDPCVRRANDGRRHRASAIPAILEHREVTTTCLVVDCGALGGNIHSNNSLDSLSEKWQSAEKCETRPAVHLRRGNARADSRENMVASLAIRPSSTAGSNSMPLATSTFPKDDELLDQCLLQPLMTVFRRILQQQGTSQRSLKAGEAPELPPPPAPPPAPPAAAPVTPPPLSRFRPAVLPRQQHSWPEEVAPGSPARPPSAGSGHGSSTPLGTSLPLDIPRKLLEATHYGSDEKDGAEKSASLEELAEEVEEEQASSAGEAATHEPGDDSEDSIFVLHS